MIYKRCVRCGKRIPSGTTCGCYSKYKEKRIYAPATGLKLLYHTTQWEMVRAYVMAQFVGIDLYAWHAQHRIVPASTVHHIVPAKEVGEAGFYEVENLLPVSDASHKEIHRAYRESEQAKKAMQDVLREAKRAWREQVSTEKAPGGGLKVLEDRS